MEYIGFDECARICREVWECLPKYYHVKLDKIAIIPNHVHFIIWICEEPGLCGDFVTAPYKYWHPSRPGGKRLTNLPTVIQTFKAEITRRIRSEFGIGFKWDISFFDHVIRNETELGTLRYYIVNNPTALNIRD